MLTIAQSQPNCLFRGHYEQIYIIHKYENFYLFKNFPKILVSNHYNIINFVIIIFSLLINFITIIIIIIAIKTVSVNFRCGYVI